jgi:hypothetical protein
MESGEKTKSKRAYLVARVAESLHLLFSNSALCTVPLLNLANQLVALAVNDVNVVVSQLAPFLLDFAFQLLPVSLDLIPVHDRDPLKRELRLWFSRTAAPHCDNKCDTQTPYLLAMRVNGALVGRTNA